MSRIMGVRQFSVSLKRSPDLIHMNRSKALFDAKKYTYTPSNPFGDDEKLKQLHRINPAYVQYVKEEEKPEWDFFTKYFHYWFTPCVIFAFWYWNKIQGDERFTSPYSRPVQEWRLWARMKRAWTGEKIEGEDYPQRRPRELTITEIHGLKKLGNKQRQVTMFENEDQKERYDQWKERKTEEKRIEDKIQKIMEAQEEKRKQEIYIRDRDRFCEKLKAEEEAKGKGNDPASP